MVEPSGGRNIKLTSRYSVVRITRVREDGKKQDF